MLQFDNLALRRGAKVLFTDVDVRIHPGFKVGVTGANGTGKSSLFSLILGGLHADAGECRVPAGWVVGHVEQEMPDDGCPAVEYVMDGDAQLRDVELRLTRAEQAGDGARVASLHDILASIDGYTARSRAERLLYGLGFRGGGIDRPVSAFSGGWRMRLNLARALMCRSDLLLLDEPTNHLDLDAVVWLEQWLRAYTGTLLLVSHDRDFLDRISDHILNIEHRTARLFAGNYSSFERQRAQQLATQRAHHARQQREIRHIQAYIDRFRYKASKARQAQSRLKALERMKSIAPAHVDSPFHFSLKDPEKIPDTLLEISECSVGYSGTPVLRDLSLALRAGDRIGLLGPNGAGKSTLVKLLAGELAPLGGRREPAKDLVAGYFAQSRLEQLRTDDTPVGHVARIEPEAGEQSVRDFLGGFGFSGEQALSPVAAFSGGEKSRLALALLVYQRPNLLLLDEPTNHLDLEMRQALADALQGFDGAMVLVSHDRHLLRVSCDRLLLVDAGRVEEYADSLDEYARWLVARGRPSTDGAAKAPHKDRKRQKRDEAELRHRLRPLARRVGAAETELERLYAEKRELERTLSDSALYDEVNKARLLGLLKHKAELDRTLAHAETAWLQASEQLECAAGGGRPRED